MNPVLDHDPIQLSNQLRSSSNIKSKSKFIWLAFYLLIIVHNLLVLPLSLIEFITLTGLAALGVVIWFYSWIRQRSSLPSNSSSLTQAIFSVCGLAVVILTGGIA